jgi:ATP-dependent RNA helicase RhlE
LTDKKNTPQHTAHAAHDVTHFSDLPLGEKILEATDLLGYASPTPVQAAAIPAVVAGRDVMAAAETGTGKTAAFLLPIFDKLGHSTRRMGPYALVVTPTRELAQQIEEVAATICSVTHHRATSVVGGLSYTPQKQALKRGCDLLVATPGRLIDLLDQNACSLDQVQTLVLDEADRMLDMGFLPSMQRIVAACPHDRQTLLFSATLDEHVLGTTKSLVHDPVRVDIAPKGKAADTIEQYVLGVSVDAKKRVLRQILKQEGVQRTIIFTNGKHRADFICKKLRQDHLSAAPIHGDRSQNQRARALRLFSEGAIDVLVATDVLARGIDVADVSCVINLDVPHEPENYIHRIGRTGRAGEHGWALTLVTADDYLELRDIEKLMGTTIPTFPRTEGLDLGDDPLVLDENRSVREKLPSRKARKKRKARRASARKGEGGAGKPAARTGEKPAARKGGAGKPAARTGEKRRADRRTRPEVRTETKTKPRRHPGDHGGIR